MVKFNDVQAQLIGLQGQFSFLGVAEVRQMAHVLEPDEQIMDCVKGWANGAVCILCATDKRVLLVDRTCDAQTVKQINYESVSAIRPTMRGFIAELTVSDRDVHHAFRSWRVKRLRDIHTFIDRHQAYVKDIAEAKQEKVRKEKFHTTIRPVSTSRNWSVFAKRIGATSVK